MEQVRGAASMRRRPAKVPRVAEVPLRPPGYAVRPPCAAPSGPDLPNWADHFVAVFVDELAQVRERLGSKVQIVSWSDCGGMAVETIARKQLIQAIGKRLEMTVTLKHYGYCDKSNDAQEFVRLNHSPLHITKDMMTLRNFETGTFTCASCGIDHELPTNGVDLYVCCFPCGPWSSRGKQLGFADKDGALCWQTIRTIKHMRPCLCAMEKVLRIDAKHVDADQSDLAVILNGINVELGDLYDVTILKGVDPCLAGFPVHKPRIILLGARKDVVVPSGLAKVASKAVQAPLPVRHDYRQLLGLQDPPIPWAKLWAAPDPSDQHKVLASGCRCSIDPYTPCPEHPCYCRSCGRNMTDCEWRKQHRQMIVKRLCNEKNNYDVIIQRYVPKLTYINLIEMAGFAGPQSCRERNMLNIISLLPELHPVPAVPGLVDKSQSISRAALRHDGTVPTMATNATMWSLPDARVLSVQEIGKLMGHDMCNTEVSGISETNLKKMLGLSLHVGTAGLIVCCLIASLAFAP